MPCGSVDGKDAHRGGGKLQFFGDDLDVIRIGAVDGMLRAVDPGINRETGLISRGSQPHRLELHLRNMHHFAIVPVDGIGDNVRRFDAQRRFENQVDRRQMKATDLRKPPGQQRRLHRQYTGRRSKPFDDLSAKYDHRQASRAKKITKPGRQRTANPSGVHASSKRTICGYYYIEFAFVVVWSRKISRLRRLPRWRSDTCHGKWLSDSNNMPSCKANG